MINRNYLLAVKKQTGLSLVELMVSLVLSLFIILVSTAFYVNNKSTYRFISSSTDVQENGRYAIHFLRESIANAGFPKVDLSLDAFPMASPPTNGVGNAPDTISVTYQAAQDCVGAPVVGVVTSAFAINADSELTCNTIPLISGVENLQIEYGVDSDGDDVPNTYQTADLVADWNQVIVVRLAILLRNQNQVRDQASSETYQLLGVRHTSADDKLHRRVFTTTIPLRNNNKGV